MRDLGAVRSQESEDILVRAAKDPDGQVRARAAAALEQVGWTPQAREALVRLCEDRDAQVAKTAARSLEHFDLAGRTLGAK